MNRRDLFRNFDGCSNHNCVVTGPKKGMGTNGMCSCLANASRTQLHLLQRRLNDYFTAQEQDRDHEEETHA